MKTNIKIVKRWPTVTKEIRKAMIDADLTYDQIGGDCTGSGWRQRINNPERMTLGALYYLSNRLGVDLSQLIH